MKIGIDIDGVILNTENMIRVKSELYDLLELNKNGVINKKGLIEAERYDWTEEELKKFRERYLLQTMREASLMPGAKEVIELLKKDNHELIIVTARGNTFKETRYEAEEQFGKYGLKFDKYYWASNDKLEVCKKENIDVMIDDRATICKAISDNRIRALYFRDVNREKLEENEFLKEVNNWGEIYRYIYNLNMEEK